MKSVVWVVTEEEYSTPQHVFKTKEKGIEYCVGKVSIYCKEDHIEIREDCFGDGKTASVGIKELSGVIYYIEQIEYTDE